MVDLGCYIECPNLGGKPERERPKEQYLLAVGLECYIECPNLEGKPERERPKGQYLLAVSLGCYIECPSVAHMLLIDTLLILWFCFKTRRIAYILFEDTQVRTKEFPVVMARDVWRYPTKF